MRGGRPEMCAGSIVLRILSEAERRSRELITIGKILTRLHEVERVFISSEFQCGFLIETTPELFAEWLSVVEEHQPELLSKKFNGYIDDQGWLYWGNS